MSTKASEPLGFVVLDEDRYPMVLGRDDVLWIAHRLWKITAFATRRQAETAIQRSKNYAARNGYSAWGSKYYVVRMIPFLRTPRKQAVAKDSAATSGRIAPRGRTRGNKKTTSRVTP